ncbi:MAG: hypothetical protein AB7U82_01910 [Blastocatellales bacterium]
MKVEQQETAMKEGVNHQADALADLPVTDEQAEEIAGSCGPNGPCRPPGGGYINNHNETTVSDEEDEIQLGDLPVADWQA